MVSPYEKKLKILLSNTSFKELHKIAVLFGQRDAEEVLTKLEKHFKRLTKHLCWYLRNVLSHGWHTKYRLRSEL